MAATETKSASTQWSRGSACVLAAALAIVASGHESRASALPTLVTITIDGLFADWKQVLLNPLQVSVDGNASLVGAGCYPTNPDRDCTQIGGNGRDILKFAWTYDSTNIYTFLIRESNTGSVMKYFFIMDLDADGLAEASDKVCRVTWNSGGPTVDVEVFGYSPANAGGDAMACPGAAACPAPGAVGFVDGYDLPGSLNLASRTYGPVTQSGAAGGDRFEVLIPWASLGVPSGTPIYWHVASKNNDAFNSAIDNVGGSDGKLGTFGVFAVSFTPNRTGAVAPGASISYCHTVENTGQFQDAYNFSATSSTASGIAFYGDDGSCGPGSLLALDANGDGDFVDPGDTAPAGADDSDADGRPDTGTMVAGALKNVVVQLRAAAGLGGSTDTLRATATSVRRPAQVSQSVVDTTRIGLVTVTPDLAASGTPGLTVNLGPHLVGNHQAVSDTLDYRVLSAQGWWIGLYDDSAGAPGTLIATDANGDGTWDASTPSITLAPGATKTVWLKVTIPAATVVGTVDAVTISAQSQSLPQANGSARDRLTVLNGLTLSPSYTAPSSQLIGPAGSSIYLPHALINSLDTPNTVTLSQTGTLAVGYTIQWWTDPNGDGNPSDGAPISGSVTLAPFGGGVYLVTEIATPASGTPSSTAARTTATGTGSAWADDHVSIGNLQTYKDPLFGIGARTFPACATIYVKALGLTPNTTTNYQLRYVDASAVVVSSQNLPTDPSGTGTGSYTLASTDGPGSWKVQLWTGATLLREVGPVAVENSGAVSLIVPAVAQNNAALPLAAVVSNTAAQSGYLGTRVSFQVDDPLGASFRSATVSPVDVTSGGAANVSTSFASVTYTVYGNYAVAASWNSSCGRLIGFASAQVPYPPPAPALLSPADNSFLSTTTPTLSGSAEPGSTVSVFVDGVLSGTSAGPSFAHVPAALSVGSHSWYATQTVNSVTSPNSATWTFTVDTSAPVPGGARDGTGVDIDFQSSSTSFDGNWDVFADTESGVTRYEWAIGTTVGGTEVQGFVDVGLSTSASASALSLASGTTYYLTVRATNGAALTATATSDGVTVDTSGPPLSLVNDGAAADIDFQTSAAVLEANWAGASDPESGTVKYEWAIGTTVGGTEVQAFVDVALSTSASATGLTLTSGAKYYVTVRATNGAGLVTLLSSDGVTVDTSGPPLSQVNDGSGADIDFQTSVTAIDANWAGASDPESGTVKYEWAIGTSAGGTEVQGFVDVALSTSVSATGLTLTSGAKYYVTVRATNGAGLTTVVTSDGVTPDFSGPAGGAVRDGTAADVDVQSSASTIDANWDPFGDAESGIAKYEWAIGTFTGGSDIQGFVDVGLSTSASATGLPLVAGATYFVSVRGTNGAGLSTVVVSDGVTVVAPDAGVPDGGSADGGGVGPDAGAGDGGASDGGLADAGAGDAGVADGGPGDAGAADGGAADGGVTDGGVTDGGATDGGATDGGAADGGATDGGATDGGATDGGATDG
ncbi:MAG: hypothetical protein HYZ28_14905, partial [Myxococcales bacterium]|nr:hypothetical protein [Myxococcales bacterium]